MSVWLYPYKQGSQSAKALGYKRIKNVNSKFKPRTYKTVVNWGSSQLPLDILNTCVIFNHPDKVAVASNKLKFFEAVKDHVSIPPYTTDYDEALNWVRDGTCVVARAVLNGNSGAGIVLIDNEDGMVEAPLYTKYIKKKHEFRVHIFQGDVIHAQKKVVKDGDIPLDTRVRNYSNGYIFAMNDINPPNMVLEEARKAVQCLSLDFGAVDVIWNEHYQKAFVLEVNTAPGLEGTTLEKYKEKFDGFN